MKKETKDVWELYTGLAILLYALNCLTGAGGVMHRILLCSAIPMLTAAVGVRIAAEGKERMTVKTAAKRLLLPYVWFSLLLTAAYAAGTLIWPEQYGYGSDAIAGLKERLIITVSLFGKGGLWLLPALFLSVAGWAVLRKIVGEKWAAISIFAAGVLYAILHQWQAFFTSAMLSEGGMQGFLLQFVLTIWRAVLTGTFVIWGMGLYAFGLKMQKQRGRAIAVAVTALLAGVVLAYFSKGYDPGQMVLGKPQFSMPAAYLISGGLYLLCDWIGRVRPVNVCGRYAHILYIALTEFGIMHAAKIVGEKVFLRFDHNFVTKTAIVLTAAALSAVAVLVLKQPGFAFLFGGEPERKEE